MRCANANCIDRLGGESQLSAELCVDEASVQEADTYAPRSLLSVQILLLNGMISGNQLASNIIAGILSASHVAYAVRTWVLHRSILSNFRHTGSRRHKSSAVHQMRG